MNGGSARDTKRGSYSAGNHGGDCLVSMEGFPSASPQSSPSRSSSSQKLLDKSLRGLGTSIFDHDSPPEEAVVVLLYPRNCP